MEESSGRPKAGVHFVEEKVLELDGKRDSRKSKEDAQGTLENIRFKDAVLGDKV